MLDLTFLVVPDFIQTLSYLKQDQYDGGNYRVFNKDVEMLLIDLV